MTMPADETNAPRTLRIEKGGRPRKDGERNQYGRLRPRHFEAITLVKFQRIIDQGDACAVDLRYQTWLSRHYITKDLTKRQAATGARIAEIYGKFDHTQGFPNRCPRSPNYDGAFRWAYDPDNLKAAETARADWHFLQKHMPTAPRLRFAIERLCVDNLLPDPGYMGQIRRALDYIADKMQIGREKTNKKSHTPLHFNAHQK